MAHEGQYGGWWRLAKHTEHQIEVTWCQCSCTDICVSFAIEKFFVMVMKRRLVTKEKMKLSKGGGRIRNIEEEDEDFIIFGSFW